MVKFTSPGTTHQLPKISTSADLLQNTVHGPARGTNEWIYVTRVLEVFQLTAKGRVDKKTMRQVATALKLMEANAQQGEPDVAVGRDLTENPVSVESQEQELMDEADEEAMGAGSDEDEDE